MLIHNANMTHLTLKIISIIILLSLLSCTKEDNTDCTAELILKYSYEHNKQNTDLFGPNVQYVKMYIFDENHILQYIDSGKGSELVNGWFKRISLPPGKYAVVSWAGSNTEFYNSFFDAHMNDASTHNFSGEAVIGQTTLSDFRIIVNHQLAEMYEEDVILPMDSLDDLYYGAFQESIEVKPNQTTVREVPLIKNTNLLRVTIEGIEHLSGYTKASNDSPLEVYTAAKNGRYMYDNSIDEFARVIRYEAPYTIKNDSSIVTEIKVLRLDLEHHTANPVKLFINHKQTKSAVAAIDVIESILKAKDLRGNYLINNQSDLDKEDLFEFKIQINTDLSVNLFVNGWSIQQSKPEV